MSAFGAKPKWAGRQSPLPRSKMTQLGSGGCSAALKTMLCCVAEIGLQRAGAGARPHHSISRHGMEGCPSRIEHASCLLQNHYFLFAKGFATSRAQSMTS